MRLFYAIWPDNEVREKLTAVSRQLDAGKTVPAENLHMTLLFLGQISDEQKQNLVSATNTFCCKQFTLNLSLFGSFKRSGVFWLAPESCPDALSNIVKNLSELAVRNHIVIDNRPYFPHVTLARKFNSEIHLSQQNISWPVSKFCLVESKTLPQGAKYHVLYTWPLT